MTQELWSNAAMDQELKGITTVGGSRGLLNKAKSPFPTPAATIGLQHLPAWKPTQLALIKEWVKGKAIPDSPPRVHYLGLAEIAAESRVSPTTMNKRYDRLANHESSPFPAPDVEVLFPRKASIVGWAAESVKTISDWWEQHSGGPRRANA